MATKKKSTKKMTAKAKANRNTTARQTSTRKKTVAPATIKSNFVFNQFALALLAAAVTYGFASWAIDSGSLWLYLFSFIGFYLTVSYLNKFVRLLLAKR